MSNFVQRVLQYYYQSYIKKPFDSQPEDGFVKNPKHVANYISYDKLPKFLQLIGTIKRTIFKISEHGNYFENIQHTSLPTFLYGSENWTLTALQTRRIEAAEMKLPRPLAGYNLYDHKTNYIRRELRITGVLDKIRGCFRK